MRTERNQLTRSVSRPWRSPVHVIAGGTVSGCIRSCRRRRRRFTAFCRTRLTCGSTGTALCGLLSFRLSSFTIGVCAIAFLMCTVIRVIFEKTSSTSPTWEAFSLNPTLTASAPVPPHDRSRRYAKPYKWLGTELVCSTAPIQMLSRQFLRQNPTLTLWRPT